MNDSIQFKDSRIISLLEQIEEYGYKSAVKLFIKKYPAFAYRFDKKEGNVSFRCINGNNKKCLVINSDLGNIPDFVSKNFEKVISIDIPEKILIQKARFESQNISNVVLESCEPGQIRLSENDYDLIILNGIQIQNLKDGSRTETKNYLNNLKEYLNNEGCLCFCAKNKNGIDIMKEEINQHYFLDNFEGYKSIVNSLGLKIESYWALPSHTHAHYSGKLTDDISLKWFFENFYKKFSVDSKFKFAGRFLKLLNKRMRKYIVLKFCPSFLFYCYKNESNDTLEKMIMRKSNFDSMIQNVRSTKILFFLLDSYGNPKKVLTCKNTRYELTEDVIQAKKEFPNMRNPDEKLVLEDWLDGNFLDGLNQEHIQLVMKWLINFQNSTQSDVFTDREIDNEIKQVRQELRKIIAMKNLPYELWLDEYKDEVKKTKLIKTAVHGDFQVRNILINEDFQEVNVIDWDWRFQENGNPIYDFVWLATSIMMFSNNPEKGILDYYKNNEKTIKSVNVIKEIMNQHLRVNFNFLRLQRFMIMRFITIREKDEDGGYMLYVNILKHLSNTAV